MYEEKDKINKFENQHSKLISNYDFLKGAYFNFINYEICILHIIVAFKKQYIEKIYNSFIKIITQEEKNEISGIIINNEKKGKFLGWSL